MGLFMLAATGWLAYWIIGETWMGFASLSWPACEGVILRADVERTLTTRGEEFNSRVTYRYEVGGRQFEGDRISYPRTSDSYSTAAPLLERVRAQYPVGKPCTVYYNPADPSGACLRPGPNWLFVGLGVVFIPLSAGSAWLFIRLAIRRFQNLAKPAAP
jgi:hypothetical protein